MSHGGMQSRAADTETLLLGEEEEEEEDEAPLPTGTWLAPWI